MSRIVAEAQPNIALIKYWGKRDAERNLPAVDSLSVTLDSLRTRMSVEFSPGSEADTLQVNGVPAPDMLERVTKCLDRVCGVQRNRAQVVSESNFPIAAGLASSASAFAALVVAADRAAGTEIETHGLARLAGAASGSAARSLYGGIVSLRSDDEGIRLEQIAAPQEWPLEVIVAVTEEGRKPIGSGEAMRRSAQTSPFYRDWVARQSADIAQAQAAIAARDFEMLAAVAEHNCLKMHSVMWTSRPPIVYWNKATLECMETIRKLQADGVPVFFTIDAGPQVKAVCLSGARNTVRDALSRTPGVVKTMESALGDGARIVTDA